MRLFILISLLVLNTAMAQEFYQIQETTIDGESISMDKFKGKTLLIVNIASQCGYTPQLEKLEALYKRYSEKGLVVLGVPTNDFGGQTPQDDQKMKEFCQKNYAVTFPILAKQTIQGKDKRPLYKYLTEQTSKRVQGEVGWNFEKFLVNKKGVVVDRMRSSMGPLDKAMIKKIEIVL